MNKYLNKNYKFLTSNNLGNIEVYLQELVNLSFEYASDFIFSYNMQDFKNIPIHVTNNDNKNEDDVINLFLSLFNMYLGKDPFYTNIYTYVCCQFKIKFQQCLQLIGLRGRANIKNFEYHLLSNLHYGLSLKDFMLTSFKTRESIIDSSVNIYSSGYLTRKLVESLRNVHIKDIKCNTKYSCKKTTVDESVVTPFLCSSNKSVCSFCLNMACNFNIATGLNKGVTSGQALGEPSTQMLLRTFHLGADMVQLSGTSISEDTVKDCEGRYKFYDQNTSAQFLSLTHTKFNEHIDKNVCKAFNGYYRKFTCYNSLHKSMFNFNTKFIILFKHFKKLWCLTKYYKNIYKDINKAVSMDKDISNAVVCRY